MITLPGLSKAVSSCMLCDAHIEANNRPTPFSGDGSSGLMLLFRNPGVQEMHRGIPCVGRVAPYVNDFLKALNLTRENTLITNTINCYTSKDREPAENEVATCATNHLVPLIKLVKPKVLVAFGKHAIDFISNGAIPSPRSREKTLLLQMNHDHQVKVISAEHPGVFLRQHSLIITWKPVLRYVALNLGIEFNPFIFPEFKEEPTNA